MRSAAAGLYAAVWLLALGASARKSRRGGRARDRERAAGHVLPWDDWSQLPDGEEAAAVDAVGEALGCTIERRALGNITEEEFEREYKFQKPLIISDATA